MMSLPFFLLFFVFFIFSFFFLLLLLLFLFESPSCPLHAASLFLFSLLFLFFLPPADATSHYDHGACSLGFPRRPLLLLALAGCLLLLHCFVLCLPTLGL